MSFTEAIRQAASVRGITRLAHLTPLRNLVHISTGGGLLSTQQLDAASRLEFNRQDLERLDGYPNHISCSIEYPNAYYLRRKREQARGEARLFPAWVCLLLAPHHLWRENTLFCPHNAAGARGANVRGGFECFQAMYADVVDAPQQRWVRTGHLACCPTDAQAEVLVECQIPLADVLAVAVASAEQAADTYAALRQLDVPVSELDFLVAPAFFDPARLTLGLRRGRRPVEIKWDAA